MMVAFLENWRPGENEKLCRILVELLSLILSKWGTSPNLWAKYWRWNQTQVRPPSCGPSNWFHLFQFCDCSAGRSYNFVFVQWKLKHAEIRPTYFLLPPTYLSPWLIMIYELASLKQKVWRSISECRILIDLRTVPKLMRPLWSFLYFDH